MKAIAFVISLFVLSVSAAQQPIGSGIYTWESSKGSNGQVLKGNTTFLSPFEISIVTLKPGEKGKADSNADSEELVIVKEGELRASINDQSKSIGPGSVIFIIPGEKYTCENRGNTNLIFYRLKYKAKNGNDLARGKSNGGSFFVDWDDLPFKTTNVGGRRDYFNRPTATTTRFEMHVTSLNAGLPSHAPHEHDEEEIILLMKGNATMTVESKEYPMVPGDFVFAASHDFHGIRNTGKSQCEYFAFQWK